MARIVLLSGDLPGRLLFSQSDLGYRSHVVRRTAKAGQSRPRGTGTAQEGEICIEIIFD